MKFSGDRQQKIDNYPLSIIRFLCRLRPSFASEVGKKR